MKNALVLLAAFGMSLAGMGYGFGSPTVGQPGAARPFGNTTHHYNANGSLGGTSRQFGNTTYHYNGNGSFGGSSQRMGNTTHHYNGNGGSLGRSSTGW